MMSTAIRLHYKHLIVVGLLLSILTFVAFRFSIHSSSEVIVIGEVPSNNYDAHAQEDDDELQTLKEKENQVPVILVDEHNEVIPHWYKGIDEGLMNPLGNTLIHIDGHSDMATPEDFNVLKKFKYKQNAHQSSYLPLMQANDVFITSAIMQGMISHIVWVQPSWNDDTQYTLSHDAYIGLTQDTKTKDTVVCDCLQRISRKLKSKSRWECTRINRAASDIEDIEIEVARKDCKKVKAFKYIVIGEDKFTKLIDLKKVKNLFVDIDEDYFGVESGVQALIDIGVKQNTLDYLDEVLPLMFCPESTIKEKKLNKEIKEFFKEISTIQSDSNEDKVRIITKNFLKLIKSNKCTKNTETHDAINSIIKLIASISKKETIGLSKASYCLFNSPRLNTHEVRFTVCHGTIYPGDDLNKIFVGTTAQIDTRVNRLGEMLDHIYQFTQPRLFTIARSLRDGYTPRKQQNYIEKAVLNKLDDVISKHGKEMNVIYDKHLVFGKDGWRD